MLNKIRAKEGFTLIEVLMVIGLMAILSVGSIVLISSTSDEIRFKATLKQMQEIREALVGKWEPASLGEAPGIALSPAWAPQAANLFGLWHLDEATGPTLEDTSGLGHTGSTLGTPILNSSGKIKTSLKSTGSGAWSAALDLSTVSTVTVVAWFNYTGCADPSECILFEFTPDSTASFGFFAAPSDSSNASFPAGSFTFGQKNSLGRFVEYTSAPSLGWHHLAVVYDRSVPATNTLTAYLDGNLISLNPTALNQSAGDPFGNSTLYFLARAGTSLSLSASIDEVAIWKSRLSAGEIKNIYDKQFTRYSPATRKYFGYLGDVGALPTLAQGISALWANPGHPVWAMNPVTRIAMGWNGPYLIQGSFGSDYSKDAWGSPYVYNPATTPPTLLSLGADRAAGGSGMNTDLSLDLGPAVLNANIEGLILNKGAEWTGNAQVELNMPNGSATLAQTLTTVVPANKGSFSFTSVPLGIRSATVYIPTKAAPTTTQGPFVISVDRAITSAVLQASF